MLYGEETPRDLKINASLFFPTVAMCQTVEVFTQFNGVGLGANFETWDE